MTTNHQDITTPRGVAVLGANGHTGRFVVAELLRRGLAPIAIGRSAARLAEAGFPSAGSNAAKRLSRMTRRWTGRLPARRQ